MRLTTSARSKCADTQYARHHNAHAGACASAQSGGMLCLARLSLPGRSSLTFGDQRRQHSTDSCKNRTHWGQRRVRMLTSQRSLRLKRSRITHCEHSFIATCLQLSKTCFSVTISSYQSPFPGHASGARRWHAIRTSIPYCEATWASLTNMSKYRYPFSSGASHGAPLPYFSSLGGSSVALSSTSLWLNKKPDVTQDSSNRFKIYH